MHLPDIYRLQVVHFFCKRYSEWCTNTLLLFILQLTLQITVSLDLLWNSIWIPVISNTSMSLKGRINHLFMGKLITSGRWVARLSKFVSLEHNAKLKIFNLMILFKTFISNWLSHQESFLYLFTYGPKPSHRI